MWGRGGLLVLIAACGQVVDVGRKDGRFTAGPPPDGWTLAAKWADGEALCAAGRTSLRFDRPGQIHAFPVRLPAGGRGLAVASGATGLDLALALYGPRAADGTFGDTPAYVDDDGLGGAPGEPRGASLTWTADAAGVWLLVVSTWQGQGRGDATLTLAVDGALGCPACVDGAGDGSPGCARVCEVTPCPATVDEWAALQKELDAARVTDPCGVADEGLRCRLRTAAEGSAWVSRLDGALEAAERAGMASGAAQALRCLGAQAAPRTLDVAVAPGGERAELSLGVPLAAGVTEAAEATLANVAQAAGVDDGSTAAWTWRGLADNGWVGTLDVRSWRGVPVDDALPVAVAWLDTDTACPDRGVLGRLTVRRVAARDAALEAPRVDAALAADAARRRCGPSCAVVEAVAALRDAAAVWRVTLECPSSCGRCLARVDATSGGVLSFDPACPDVDAAGQGDAAGVAFLGASACAARDGVPCWRLEGGLLTTGLCAAGACNDDGSRDCLALEAQWREAAGRVESGFCGPDGACEAVGGAGACGELTLLGPGAGIAVPQGARATLDTLDAAYRATPCDNWRALGGPRSWSVRPTYAPRCEDQRCMTEAAVCP